MTEPAENTPTAIVPTRYAAEVLEFLAEEGFRPSLDDEGDVVFKYEGSWYFLVTSRDDATYFALYHLRFWPLDDAAERLRAHEAAALAHMNIRIGRVTVLDDNVSASIDAYLPDDQAWRGLLMRNLSGLQALVRAFRESMHAQLEN